MKTVGGFVLVSVSLCIPNAQLHATPAQIDTEEFMIPTPDPGINLYVRNKHPSRVKRFPAEKILLFVHGSTYPSEVSFDLRLNGLSWMEYIAQRGYDVYLVDMPGYGRSTRLVEMDAPADQHGPVCRTKTQLTDISATIDFILRRRHAKKLDLMGWSWGTVAMGWYTARHNDKVEKLILYAPAWLGNFSHSGDDDRPLGAYRIVAREANAPWLESVPANKRSDVMPPGWYTAWADAAFTSDSNGVALVPPVLRAPNGFAEDQRDLARMRKPLPYDLGEIRVPTFVTRGEWDDKDMATSLFENLVNAPYKRYVVIGEGTHFVLIEKNRMQLFQEVQHFLDERPLIR